ncbi:MAG TPA: hypoxanthine phosphoribosyltransferase [Bacteroidales bacterium]|nr:hypoxanthine phosphoribosyltransferase [Bacteroidales bacterium]
MQKVTVKDRVFELLLSSAEIDGAVQRIADRINTDYKGKDILFIGILNGSFVFAADLLRRITLPCRISFVKYESYSGTASTQKVQELLGLKENISGRNVIVVEDIVDTGITMDHVLEQLKSRNPSDLKLAALFFKPEAFKKTFPIDYLGLEIPNRFVVGYGLDYDGYGRNLRNLYQIAK